MEALEALSFPKTEDEPWRRTPDILISEDVPPIFLQMRLATVHDVKKAKRSVPKAEKRKNLHWCKPFKEREGVCVDRLGFRVFGGGWWNLRSQASFRIYVF